MFFGKKPEQEKDPAAQSRDLREMALSVTAADLKLAPIEARPHVWGVLMEMGYPDAVATLSVFADGSASLYISTGGGVIGAGEHKPVREEGDRLLSVVESHVAEFVRVDETPYPKRGRVRFYVRTFQTTLTAEADEKLLQDRQHTLSPVYIAGHAVLTQMRLMSERQGKT